MAVNDKRSLFETEAVPKALLTMALPTIVSQLIALIYNMADTWFIGRTNNPYMVAASSLVLTFADGIIRAFIANAETVRLGTVFLRARCVATPFMFLSFNMVNFMQAVDRGREAFWLPVIRQIALNIPLLFILDGLFGLMGIVRTQAAADILNVVVSYIIYWRALRQINTKEATS